MSETDSKANPRGLDGLCPFSEFPRIESPTPYDEGVRTMVSRLGYSNAGVFRSMMDRYPGNPPEKRTADRFRCKNFLKFDLIFSDTLHATYAEMRNIGLGRKFLKARILRAVLSGICDSEDPSGLSGDFPPRSSLDSVTRERVRSLQASCMREMTVSCKASLHALRVRMDLMSTGVLKVLEANVPSIRKEVCKAEKTERNSGIKRFFSILSAMREELYERTHKSSLRHRRKVQERVLRDCYMYWMSPLVFKRDKPRKDGRPRKLRKLERRMKNRKSQIPWKNLGRKCHDLKIFLDRDIPNWVRRPTDEDWEERERHLNDSDRKVVCRLHPALFRKLGLWGMKGITEPLMAKDWESVRTDWRISEARENYRLMTQETQGTPGTPETQEAQEAQDSQVSQVSQDSQDSKALQDQSAGQPGT